jgi:O-antigen ligase
VSPARAVDREEPDSADAAAVVGERVRRVALGLAAALVTARAYTWSEPDLEFGAGRGLSWVLALLVVAGVAIASGLIGGRFRFRWSWADVTVVALTVLVAFSSRHALDRRPAINLAWEWIALGVTYLLLRNLPRTRGESSVIAGAMVATAFAVSVYGLYQVGVELPALQAQFARNPGLMLAGRGIAPNTPAAAQFANRLVGSNEPWSTFALPNSLAGFIVGPLVLALAVWWSNLIHRDPSRPRWRPRLLAAPVILVLLVCLMLTKSRSAWIGLLVGVGSVLWQSRTLVSRRVLLTAGGWGLAIVAILAGFGLTTGRLDREVLTQSSMSMRYRWEYWQGTWRMLTWRTNEGLSMPRPAFWWGVGPGNFRTEYLRYKLPQSSEEILDPHNLFLEVLATAGFWAMLALALAVTLGLRELLGPPRAGKPGSNGQKPWFADDPADLPPHLKGQENEGDAPPRRLRWLVASAGAGWILVVLLGMMNLFEIDLFPRWLILGGSWLVAVLLGAPLWRRLPIPAVAMGAAFAAVVVNLLAAGGIGIPTVALGLWSALAIGLNLREDRFCGQLREYASRVPPFVLSTVWAAVVGLFLGAVIPYWRSEAAIADAEDAMRRQPPDFNRAKNDFEAAIAADRYYVRPWLGYAEMAYQAWEWGGGHASDLRWETIPKLLENAASAPRNPMSWSLHLRCAEMTRQLLRRVSSELKPVEAIRYQGKVVKEIRTASLLYPSNAMLHAQLAEASAEMSEFGGAVKAAEEALRLDRLNPHADKKLPDDRRERLESMLAEWRRRDRK